VVGGREGCGSGCCGGMGSSGGIVVHRMLGLALTKFYFWVAGEEEAGHMGKRGGCEGTRVDVLAIHANTIRAQI
jgi:hypothetical protein